jgi:hypothetical protein
VNDGHKMAPAASLCHPLPAESPLSRGWINLLA